MENLSALDLRYTIGAFSNLEATCRVARDECVAIGMHVTSNGHVLERS